jgi:hypothetical protein
LAAVWCFQNLCQLQNRFILHDINVNEREQSHWETCLFNGCHPDRLLPLVPQRQFLLGIVLQCTYSALHLPVQFNFMSPSAEWFCP